MQIALQAGQMAACQPQGMSFIPIIGSLVVAVVTLLVGLRAASVALISSRRTLRANVISTYRQKWLDQFREDISRYLSLGQRLYKQAASRNPHESGDLTDFAQVGQRLAILLGMEPGPRNQLRKTIQRYSRQPSPRRAELIERRAQKVFRERWEQIKLFDEPLPKDQELTRFGQLFDSLGWLRRVSSVADPSIAKAARG